MSMNRKHFETIAGTIREARDHETVDAALNYVARQLAYMCREENSRFDRDKFFTACGVEYPV